VSADFSREDVAGADSRAGGVEEEKAEKSLKRLCIRKKLLGSRAELLA
jgi:hypothetical protein